MIKFSVNLHRGCFGGCSFCTISAHQGKFVSSRSEESILRRGLRKSLQMPGFKGYLSDLGGPSANMYRMGGRKPGAVRANAAVRRASIRRCAGTSNNRPPAADRIYTARYPAVKGIKKAFIGSGIRYDLFGNSDGGAYLREVILKPCVRDGSKWPPNTPRNDVLQLMRKPPFAPIP